MSSLATSSVVVVFCRTRLLTAEALVRARHRSRLFSWCLQRCHGSHCDECVYTLPPWHSVVSGRLWKALHIDRREESWREETLTVKKKLKGGPFGIFQHPFCRKTAKNWKGDPLRKKIPGKKSCSAETNWDEGPFGLARYVMLHGKTGKTFLVQFARPNGEIWCNNVLYNF